MARDLKIFITKLKEHDVVHTITSMGLNLSMDLNVFLTILEKEVSAKIAKGISFEQAYEDSCRSLLSAIVRESTKTAMQR